MPDFRAKFIANTIIAASIDAEPDKTPPAFGDDELAMIEFGLKVFDALLPMIVSHVVAEYKKQENQ